MNNVLEFLPLSSWKELILWALCFALLLCIYYPILHIYSRIDARVRAERWSSCGVDESICGQRDSIGELALTIRTPKYASDFIQEDVSITVENNSEQLRQDVIVTIQWDLEDPTPHERSSCIVEFDTAREDQFEFQNSFIYDSIPPFSQVTQVGKIRVSNCQKGTRLEAAILVNGERFEPSFRINLVFNQWKALFVWVGRVFLLPPGNNLAVAILAAMLAKGGATMDLKGWWSEKAKPWLYDKIGRHLGARRKSEQSENTDQASSATTTSTSAE